MDARIQTLLTEIANLVSLQNDDYQDMQETLRRIETKISDIERRQQEQQQFIDNQFTDAVQARDVWRHNAEQHKQQAERFREKLTALQALTEHIGTITEHPHFIKAEKQPPLKVVVNEADGHALTVVDETLDA